MNIFGQNTESSFAGDVDITGDAIIEGSLNVEGELSTNDSLIEIASNNTVSNNKDIGFYGVTNTGGIKYSGLIRNSTGNEWSLTSDSPTKPNPSLHTYPDLGALNLSTLLIEETAGNTNPSIISQAQPTTGINWDSLQPGNLGFVCSGSDVFSCEPTRVIFGDSTGGTFYEFPITRGTLGQILKTDANGVVTWQTDTAGGALALDGSTNMDNGAQAIIDNGTQVAPGLAFVGDLDTGLFSLNPGEIDFSCNNNEVLLLNNTSIDTFRPLRSVQSGSAVAPSFSFFGSPNNSCGIYQPSSTELSISANGVETMNFTDSVINSRKDMIFTATGPNDRRFIDLASEHDTSSANMKFFRKRNSGDPNLINGNDMINIFGLGWSTGLGTYHTSSQITSEATGTWTASDYPTQLQLVTFSGGLGNSGIYCGYDGTEKNIILTPTDNQLNGFKINTTNSYLTVPLQMTLSNVPNKIHLIDTTSTGGSFITLQQDTNPVNRRRICFYLTNLEDMRICSQNDAGTNIMDLMKIRNAVTQTNNGIEVQQGNAGNTAYGFVQDTGTSGMYRIGTNNIGFSTNSINRLSISASDITSTLPIYSSDFDSSSGNINLGTINASSVTISKIGTTTSIKGTTNLDGAVTFGTGGTSYVLPTTRGTNNQILRTNGSGVVTWNEPIFGQHYQYSNSEGLSTTTNSTFQQKLRMTTGTLTAGTYRITWYAEFKNDNGAGGQVRLRLDDTTPPTGGTIISECFTDSSIDGGFQQSSGIHNQVLSASTHTIDINYNAVGGTTEIKRARIEIMRVL